MVLTRNVSGKFLFFYEPKIKRTPSNSCWPAKCCLYNSNTFRSIITRAPETWWPFCGQSESGSEAPPQKSSLFVLFSRGFTLFRCFSYDYYPNHRGLLADCCRPSQHVPDHYKPIGNIQPMIHCCIADNHNISPIVADLSQTWCREHSQIIADMRR